MHYLSTAYWREIEYGVKRCTNFYMRSEKKDAEEERYFEVGTWIGHLVFHGVKGASGNEKRLYSTDLRATEY